MANRNRDAGREQAWRRLLAKHGRSGLSVRAFCRREKLSEPSFYAWRGTIRERDAMENRATRRTSPSPGPAFLPVAIREVPTVDGALVIELRGGRVLRLPESIAASRVAELVHALEAAPVTEIKL